MWLKTLKILFLWKYVISGLNDEEIVGTFYKEELQNTNQIEFRVEKVINKNVDKLFIIQKGYDNSFNSSINKKDIV